MADWMFIAIGLLLGAAIVWGWLQSRAGALSSQLAVAQTSLAEREKEAASLKVQLATATQERDARESELSTVRESASGLQASLAARQEEIVTLREQVQQLRTATEADDVALTQALQEAASLKSLTDERASQLAIAHKKHADLESSIASLTADVRSLREERATIEAQHAALQEQKAQLDSFLADAQKQLKDAFAALAQTALDDSQKRFLAQAEERMKSQQELAASDLTAKQQQIADVLTPVKETLLKLEAQTLQLEQSRMQELGSVKEQLKTIGESHILLSGETRRLTDALKSSRVRGRWGEIALERLLELAGLVNRSDYFLQETQDKDGAKLRPDCIVRMPGGRAIVIDAKVPFTGYYEAHEATSDEDRLLALKRHADAVQGHIKTLATKDYQKQVPEAGGFVVMFVPNDSFLAAALEQRPELTDFALAESVLPVTPAALLALLHTVQLGWQQQAGFENAEAIRLLGQELYDRLGKFVEDLSKLGTSLDRSRDLFNEAVTSLEKRSLVTARKLSEYGIKTNAKRPLTLAIEGSLIVAPEPEGERPMLQN